MTVRTVFANESGNQPASQLDAMFGDVWNNNTLSCTVTGTNALTLTPRSNVNLPTSYVPNQRVAFTASANSTGSVTAQIGSLASLNVYQPGGTQAGAGNIVANTLYELAYDANLNTGAGGWWMVSATASAPSVAQPVQGGHKNLQITNGGTPATQVLLTADQVIAQNSGGGTVKISSLSVTISTATNGANGLDTGTVASSTFYSVWAIYNGTTATAAGLISTSATAPTLPSGYTYKSRLGWVLTDGSANLYRFIQLDREFQFVVGTNPANLGAAPFLLASGVVGTFSATSPTLTSTSVSTIVPPTANKITFIAANRWKTGTISQVLVAPNTSWGGANNGPEGSNGNSYPCFMDNTAALSLRFEMILEALSIAIATSAAGAAVTCIGWTDNL